MALDKDVKYSLSLHDLKAQFLQGDALQKYILREDVIKKGILLLSKGKKLTFGIADKLSRFGITEIKVYYNEKDYEEEEYAVVEQLKKNFVKNMKVAIVNNDFKSIGLLAKILIRLGFSEKNISAFPASYFERNSLIANGEPDYLFFDTSLYVYVQKMFNTAKCRRIFISGSEKIHLNNINTVKISPNVKLKEFEEKLLHYTDKDFHRLLQNQKADEIEVKTTEIRLEPLFIV